MLKYLPIIFLQSYLILTLILFQFGVVDYNIPNPAFFWSFIISYHVAWLCGFLIGIKNGLFKVTHFVSSPAENYRLFNKSFYIFILTLSFLASIISFKGADSLFSLINPLFWFDSAIQGITNPGLVYDNKMDRVISGEGGNKVLNVFLFCIAFSKYLLVTMIVFYWSCIGFKLRFISLLVSILPALASMSHGTNKGVFDVLFLFSFSIVFILIANKYRFGVYNILRYKFFITIILAALASSILFFKLTMSHRGGDIRLIETVDRLNYIQVAVSQSDLIDSSVLYTFSWLSTYVTQGYYGFAIALTQDFDTTFGIGNSVFLTRNVESALGIDLRSRTFQYKIDPWWGETSQWHSFYSYFANDFHFVGVTFVCFLLAFYLARVWIIFLNENNLFACSLLSVFAIMILYIPANNQIFGFLDGLSAFLFLSILMFLSRKKVRVGRFLIRVS